MHRRIERVVLVGLMCAGKSTVGRLLARRLGWDFVDFDEVIQRDQGASISEIFRERGERYFRSLEAELTRGLAAKRETVLAPGGGWISQPDLVERLRPSSLIVWLRVAPEVALERHHAQAGAARPLLAVDDPVQRLRELLAARAPFYRTADLSVETDRRRPAELVEDIVAAVLGEASEGVTAGSVDN